MIVQHLPFLSTVTAASYTSYSDMKMPKGLCHMNGDYSVCVSNRMLCAHRSSKDILNPQQTHLCIITCKRTTACVSVVQHPKTVHLKTGKKKLHISNLLKKMKESHVKS